MFKTKKGKYQLSFLILVRAQGLAPPPRRSFANAQRRPKVRLSLVVEPLLQCSLPYYAFKTKKLPFGSFLFLWYARRDWLRRHGAHSLMLTGVLPSAFRLWSSPFSRVLSLTALKKQKNSHLGVFCFFGTRAGIGSAATALIRKCSTAYFRPPFACGRPLSPGFFPLLR